MADFDSYFKDEKVAPGNTPTRLGGQSFDSYFAEEAPKEGINELPEKRSGAVRKAVEVGLPMALTGGAGILSRPMGIVGRYGLDAISGAAGEGVLQALGISEESPSMIALSAIANPTGRLLGSAALGLPKVMCVPCQVKLSHMETPRLRMTPSRATCRPCSRTGLSCLPPLRSTSRKGSRSISLP